MKVSKRTFRLTLFSLFILAASSLAFAPRIQAQNLDRIERERALQMLGVLKGELKKNYYDSNMRGIDIEAQFSAAEEKIKQATSLGQAFGIIAQVFLNLNDSHTKFYPPARPEKIEYGWRMQMFGDDCYVTAVKPGSDAAAQGLKPGDRILQIERFRPTRKEFWKMRYYYNALSPRPGLQLVVQSPGGEPRTVNIKAKVTPGSVVLDLTNDLLVNDYIRALEGSATRHRYYDNVGGVFIWRMPTFTASDRLIDEMMSRAKKASAVILDLRGNGGGAETGLLRMLGYFFDKDVQVANIKTRKETKPLVAKTRGKDAFTGKLIVLIDSESASSSELFARTVQLQKRGVVLGDKSAGAVMRSMLHSYELGANNLVMYFASITDADALMPDGQPIEGVGITPDELIIPKGEHMAAGRDPVLVRALELAEAKVDLAKVGDMFPYNWNEEK